MIEKVSGAPGCLLSGRRIFWGGRALSGEEDGSAQETALPPAGLLGAS